MLRLVEFWLEEAVCDSQRSVGHEQHGELELGYKFTWTQTELEITSNGPTGYTIWISNVSGNRVQTSVGIIVALTRQVKFMVKTDLFRF